MYSTDKYKGEIQTNTKGKYRQSGGEIEKMTGMKKKTEKKFTQLQRDIRINRGRN